MRRSVFYDLDSALQDDCFDQEELDMRFVPTILLVTGTVILGVSFDPFYVVGIVLVILGSSLLARNEKRN